MESARVPPALEASSASPMSTNPLPRAARVVFLVWLLLALGLAATKALQGALPLIGVLAFTAIGGSLLAWRRSPALRAWTAGLDLRVPLLIHVSRLGFGALFLVEYAAGRLPATFAERGGYGDLVAGGLALVAVAAWSTARLGRPLAWLFSVVGLVDILVVFATAQLGVLRDQDPLLIGAIARLPYALLPTVVVPLVILSHLLIIQRLRAGAAPTRSR